ncbi:GPI- c transferase complex [Pyrenophora seminiperda CCB06]|uniref:GPI-c transferase complex n=1 Tax=Pyrenophora seminiperda CCB06 TaxID=1302712 RepID=A0A3M7MGW4_9PLEO|nr:GPI- c transferase complex [Pyrenophora seminiperda CCB06]
MSSLIHNLNSPASQTLHILEPTPSTITYTVSTRRVPKTLAARVGYHVGILARVALGLASVLLLWAKWLVWSKQQQPQQQSLGYLFQILGSSSEEGQGQMVRLLESWQWRYLVPGAWLVVFLVFRRTYTEESLTMLRGLGLQTSTTSSTYLQTPTTRFIPTTSIQDVFIYEAFKGFEVRFYLMVVVEGEGEVVVVFPSLLPRRDVLEVVWRGVRGSLWEGDREKTHIGATPQTHTSPIPVSP